MPVAQDEIIRACLALGFAGAGVCAAAPSMQADRFFRWLAEGRHGSMDWLAEMVDRRLDVRQLIDGREAKSVIMVADQYAVPGVPEAPPPEGYGRIARYARGRDYHAVIRRRLHRLADRLRRAHPGEEFRTFVDTAPVMEREHAVRAGLGFIGKNTLLIDPRRGSYLLLGGMATTLEIEPSGATIAGDHCGTCTRCIDQCPTGALEPWRIDARRCISYLTIEHEGAIDAEFHAAMKDGGWLFGCDTCQDVCPYNMPHEGSLRGRVHPLYRDREGLKGGRVRLDEVRAWTEEDRRVRLTVSAGKRASLPMLKRNAAIVAGA